MKIIVKAKPHSKKVLVEKITQSTLEFEDSPSTLPIYKVSVTELATEGKANKAIISALAVYFNVAPSLITLISGPTSKQKIFEIDL